MARDLTSGAITAITSDVVAPALLVSAEFDEGEVNIWSGYGDFVYDGKTFSGVGDFGTIGDVEESESIQANGVVYTLSGIPSSLISAAMTYQYQGRPIKAWVAFFDVSTNALIADPYQLSAARMDTMTINEGSKTATIALTAESLLIDLNRPRNRRYTNEDQIAEYPGDVFFEYVVSLIERDVTWGVNTAKSGSSNTGPYAYDEFYTQGRG
jgi:hypothetical protein